RPGIAGLVARLSAVPGIRERPITTNGDLLARHLHDLVAAGRDRVNVSLDSLDPERFPQITRRLDPCRVLEGQPPCQRHPGLRPPAAGQLRTCLFATEETDLRASLREGASDAEIETIVRGAVAAKGPGHGMADPEWTYAGRPMSLSGG